MIQPTHTPLVINGWTVFAHPLFLEQVERLSDAERIELRRALLEQA